MMTRRLPRPIPSLMAALLALLIPGGALAYTVEQERMATPDQIFVLPLPGGGMVMFQPEGESEGLSLFRFYGGGDGVEGIDLEVGDVLVAINGDSSKTIAEAKAAHASVAAGASFELEVIRGGTRRVARIPGTTAGSAGQEPIAAEPRVGMEAVEFFLGEWDIEALSADGSQVVGRARTEVRHILDGTAMQADYYGLDPAGNTVFRGTTIRTHVPSIGRFAVHWAMANLPGYTYIDEEYGDGELHGDGRGFDGQGEFVERYRYFDISNEHYSFEMSRSYDGGATWNPYANLRATKRVDG